MLQQLTSHSYTPFRSDYLHIARSKGVSVTAFSKFIFLRVLFMILGEFMETKDYRFSVIMYFILT